jgi:hypothetical protein
MLYKFTALGSRREQIHEFDVEVVEGDRIEDFIVIKVAAEEIGEELANLAAELFDKPILIVGDDVEFMRMEKIDEKS